LSADLAREETLICETLVSEPLVLTQLTAEPEVVASAA